MVQALEEAHRQKSIEAVLAGAPSGAGATHCADCGDEIPAARRDANPAAETCIYCQEIRERK